MLIHDGWILYTLNLHKQSHNNFKWFYKTKKKCKDLLVYISYHHASVYTCTCIYLGCVYTVNYIFLPIQGASEVYIPYKLFSKVCNVYLVVLKKNWGKKFIYQQILI